MAKIARNIIHDRFMERDTMRLFLIIILFPIYKKNIDMDEKICQVCSEKILPGDYYLSLAYTNELIHRVCIDIKMDPVKLYFILNK